MVNGHNREEVPEELTIARKFLAPAMQATLAGIHSSQLNADAILCCLLEIAGFIAVGTGLTVEEYTQLVQRLYKNAVDTEETVQDKVKQVIITG